MPALTCTALGAAVILGVVVMSGAAPHYPRKTSVAHRGASAYAPEHTLAAYRLALEQGADFVEQDLAVTRDGILICLHDPSLERTTDVEARFPDRFTEVTYRGEPRKVWLANDFTLAEIKRLDAGSWFGEADSVIQNQPFQAYSLTWTRPGDGAIVKCREHWRGHVLVGRAAAVIPKQIPRARSEAKSKPGNRRE